MNISRDNYESWFLDYLDGRLNAGQEELLMSFLEFNPDLRQELEGLEMVRLDGGEMRYELMAVLRKPDPAPDPQNVLDHFEDYCLLSIEQQLSPAEEQILQGIIEDDAGKNRVFGLYQSTLLKADEDLVYPGKSGLKKRFIHNPLARIVAASVAASALLMLALFPLFRNAGDRVADSQQLYLPSENSESRASLEDRTRITGTEQNGSVKAPASTVKKERFSSPDRVTGPAMDFNSPGRTSPEADHEVPAHASLQMAKIESITAGKLQYSHQPGDPSLAYRNRVRVTDDDLSLEEYALLRLKGRITGNRAERRFSLWNIADAGIQKINEALEEDYSLERETDGYGNVRRLTLETPAFGISAPLRAVDLPGE